MAPLNRRTFIAAGASAGIAMTTLGAPATLLAQDDKPTVTVGSTNYTEQFILAEMLALLLDDAGYPTEVEHNIGGTAVIHEARNAGDVDTHVEYTGSGLTILEKDVSEIRDENSTPEEVVEQVYEVVKEGYKEEFNAIWLDPIGINNTYALAMRREHAEELGVETISDLADHAADLELGGSQEFVVRPDGLPGLEEAYGFEFGTSGGMESGLMYQALENEDVDVISAFATDGRIVSLDFVLLEDDKGFFPPYYAAPVVRQELLEASPEAEEVLNQLAGKIDNETMAGLNLRVDEGGEEPRPVARDFLEQEGLIGASE
jgi:glycine betaine/choline ABC-type transport system substrate-binding protein